MMNLELLLQTLDFKKCDWLTVTDWQTEQNLEMLSHLKRRYLKVKFIHDHSYNYNHFFSFVIAWSVVIYVYIALCFFFSKVPSFLWLIFVNNSDGEEGCYKIFYIFWFYLNSQIPVHLTSSYSWQMISASMTSPGTIPTSSLPTSRIWQVQESS